MRYDRIIEVCTLKICEGGEKMGIWERIGDIVMTLVMALLFSAADFACINTARQLLKSGNRKAGVFMMILSTFVLAAGLIMLGLAAVSIQQSWSC